MPTGGTTGSAIESFFRNFGNDSAYRMIEFGDKTRRSFLRVGSLGHGAAALSLPQYLAAKAIHPSLVKDRSIDC